MKHLLFTLFFSLLVVCCTSKVHKEYYPNGTIKEEYAMINGNLEGEFKAYYNDGSCQALGQFLNGKMVGKWIYYYPKEIVQSIQVFENGKIVSIDFWDINGNQTISNGSGTAILYYSTGNIKSKMSYKNCEYHGICETWFPNGVKSTEFMYNDGNPEGEWLYWDEKGNIIKKEKYN